jgi:hypothetical protein
MPGAAGRHNGAALMATPMRDYPRHSSWITTSTGRHYFLDGACPILDQDFDYPDERWVADHFEAHGSIGTEVPESRALFEPPPDKERRQALAAIFSQPTRASVAPSDPDEAAARNFNMTPEALRELRAWVLKVNKEYEERLARENVVVFKLNEQRTSMTLVGYMTKEEAAKAAPGIIAGELLELDNYGGMFVRADHLFISENKIAEGLNRYGPDVTLGALIDHLIDERNERQAA